jgi:hypothetical protein
MFDDLARSQDWDGVLDFGCLLLNETTYALTADDYLELGEAWWRHAAVLGPELGAWAGEQAVSCWLQAGSKYHLQFGRQIPNQRRNSKQGARDAA